MFRQDFLVVGDLTVDAQSGGKKISQVDGLGPGKRHKRAPLNLIAIGIKKHDGPRVIPIHICAKGFQP